jgi:hypothetical protein
MAASASAQGSGWGVTAKASVGYESGMSMKSTQIIGVYEHEMVYGEEFISNIYNLKFDLSAIKILSKTSSHDKLQQSKMNKDEFNKIFGD